jgi:hypothetical protein
MAPVEVDLACGAAAVREDVAVKPDPGRFGAVMQGLQALATTPNPEAALVEACERIMVLRDELTRMYQAGARGYWADVVEIIDEWRGLQLLVVTTPARTRLGRMAKANVALAMLSAKGDVADMARSVIQDFINNPDVQPAP